MTGEAMYRFVSSTVKAFAIGGAIAKKVIMFTIIFIIPTKYIRVIKR